MRYLVGIILVVMMMYLMIIGVTCNRLDKRLNTLEGALGIEFLKSWEEEEKKRKG